MRIVTAAILAAFVGLLLPGAVAQAQTAPSGIRTAQAAPTDTSAQQRRRVIRRVPIYPREEWRPPVYPQYKQPTWRVKVGDYFSRIEAQQVLLRIKDLAPNAIIVAEQINVK